MPLISTRGAASARGFGFGASTGTAPTGFKYASLGGTSTQTMFYGSSMVPSGAPTSYPSSFVMVSGTPPGIVLDGNFIATPVFISTNNTASWITWGLGVQSPSQAIQWTGGLNGAIAYNQTAKRVATTYVYLAGKSGYNQRFTTILSTNTGQTNYDFSMGGTPYPAKQVIYSPALDIFVLCGWGSGTAFSSFNGTTGAAINTTSSSWGNWRAGISHDGYPLITQFNGSTAYFLRKYTSSDLNAFTTLGTMPTAVQGIAYHSPLTWCPVNGRYFEVCSGSGGTIYISRSTGNDPTTTTFYTSIGTIYSPIYQPQIFEDKDTGYLYLTALTAYTSKGTSYAGYMARSTDGGTTWTPTDVISRSFARNFSYP